MRVAPLSEIHGNFIALDAVLSDIAEQGECLNSLRPFQMHASSEAIPIDKAFVWRYWSELKRPVLSCMC